MNFTIKPIHSLNDISFYIQFGTPSDDTGPRSAKEGKFYVYTEASSKSIGDKGVMEISISKSNLSMFNMVNPIGTCSINLCIGLLWSGKHPLLTGHTAMRPWSKLGIRDYLSSKQVWERQSNKGYETNPSKCDPGIICDRKQSHFSNRRICENMALDEIYSKRTFISKQMVSVFKKSVSFKATLKWYFYKDLCGRVVKTSVSYHKASHFQPISVRILLVQM
jgi:hypothetical protein